MSATQEVDPIAGRDRLRLAAAALQLELTIEQCTRLTQYVDLILRWNRVHNLTSIRHPQGILTHHLLDCLAAVPALRREGTTRGGWRRLLDAGSGAGLPGIVFAVMQPDVHVTCVDSIGKKTAFVAQAVAELGMTNIEAVHARVETIRSADFDLICSRAFATLDTFVYETAEALAAHGVWLAMKGHNPEAEIEVAAKRVEVFHVEQLRLPEALGARCLVWARKHSSLA